MGASEAVKNENHIKPVIFRYTKMKLKDKTIVLTGGSSGIGYAIAKKLGEMGNRVHSFDIQPPSQTLNNVRHQTVDITQAEAVERAIRDIMLEEKEIHVLINNAGIVRRGTLAELSEAEWYLTMGINVKGRWLMLKHLKPYFTPATIVLQICSRRALYLPADPGIYALSKASVAIMAQLFAKAVPIKLKIAYPGPVETPLSHYGRTEEQEKEVKDVRITPEEMAEKLIALLQSENKELAYDQERNIYLMR